MEENKFELWAIVELFGHQKMCGKVTEQTVGSSTWIRVDVPETKGNPSFTRMLHPNAIYAINPVTEEVAKIKCEQMVVQPIEAWDINRMQQKILELKSAPTKPEFTEDEIRDIFED
jgi:hypothetical protein